MGLLDLPPEIRLQIFEYLPDLSYGRHAAEGPNYRLTPAICRVSHAIRIETLPLYAKTSSFIIQTDDRWIQSKNGVQAWLQALGETAISYVQSLQLSRQWKLKQPTRWQGHVGFYVRLQLIENAWRCTAGTYPIANDIRGMRSESVDLLRHVVMQRLRRLSTGESVKGLSASDVEFILDAMDIVSSHPISNYDTEQSEAGKKRRREIWSSMEQKLLALDIGSCEQAGTGLPFHTPY